MITITITLAITITIINTITTIIGIGIAITILKIEFFSFLWRSAVSGSSDRLKKIFKTNNNIKTNIEHHNMLDFFIKIFPGNFSFISLLFAIRLLIE